MRKLRDAHAPVDSALLGVSVQAGSFADIVSGNARNFLGILGSELFEALDEIIEALSAVLDELGIDQPFLDNDVRHRSQHGDVGARLERQPQLGEVDQVDAARVDDDQLSPVFADSLLHLQGDDRVVLACIRAGHDHHIVMDDLAGRVRHGRRAQCLLQRHHATRMAQACAMIHVVGAEQRPEHLLKQVVVLVGGFGTAIDGHGVRAIALVDLDEMIGNEVEGSVPIGFHPIPIVRDLRIGN